MLCVRNAIKKFMGITGTKDKSNIDGEPDTSRGVSPVRGGDYVNLPQKCDKATFSYSTHR